MHLAPVRYQVVSIPLWVSRRQRHSPCGIRATPQGAGKVGPQLVYQQTQHYYSRLHGCWTWHVTGGRSVQDCVVLLPPILALTLACTCSFCNLQRNLQGGMEKVCLPRRFSVLLTPRLPTSSLHNSVEDRPEVSGSVFVVRQQPHHHHTSCTSGGLNCPVQLGGTGRRECSVV